MWKGGDLEQELRQWREERARKGMATPQPTERRTVRVNGHPVIVVKKPRRRIPLA